MSGDRWVVLGLGHPRAGWFSELSRWSTAAAIPVDFVKCVSADEVRARLRGGRAYSALLVGGDVVGFDRDLVDSVRSVGACVIVVDPPGERAWAELGVAGVLTAGFDRTDLLSALTHHAAPIARIAAAPPHPPATTPDSWRGRLIAITGAGGVGRSTTAMAVAQAFGDEADSNSTLLADFCLDAELGMLHDCREVMPSVQELADAHRGGSLGPDQVRSLTFAAATRGYDLLVGLRRHRDWTAIRRRAFEAALESLLASYAVVIADVDADIEGESSTGSIDVEDRNLMARTTLTRADAVVVVGQPTTKGIHSLTRVLGALLSGGVTPERILPVLTRSPRRPRRRAEATGALARLLDADGAGRGLGNPVHISERDIEDAIRDGARLPAALGRSLHGELQRRLEQPGADRPVTDAESVIPEPVVPGSLGAWTEAG